MSAIDAGITTGLAVQGGDTIMNSLSKITNVIGSIREASMLPNSAKGNVNGGDINFITSNLTFNFYNMSIKEEFLKIVDDFFTKFGYKINRVKTPNLHSRNNWNYIKTIDINITGNVPLYAINELKQMFNDGCTLWHNANNIFNYNLENNII